LTDDNKQNSDIPSLSINEVVTTSSNPKKTNYTQYGNEKTPKDWGRIIFDGLLVLFNGLLALFTYRLYRSTEKMWKATKDTAEAAKQSAGYLYTIERAYIYAVVLFSRVDFEGDAAVTQTEIKIWNYGRTPAIINRIKILGNFEPKIPPGQETDVFPRRFVAGILDKDPIVRTVDLPIKAQDWEDIRASKKRFFILIRIEYQEVFGNPDTKDFWWVYKPIDNVWSVYKYKKDG
jgi:hypothetical protein